MCRSTLKRDCFKISTSQDRAVEGCDTSRRLRPSLMSPFGREPTNYELHDRNGL